MKKFLPVIIVLLLILAGGYYVYSQKGKSQQAQNTNQPQSANVFSSIKDALSKSITLQCSFTDEQNHKTTAYIKAGAVRADVMGSDKTQQFNNSSIIIKDKKMYLWDVVKKQGMVIDMTNEQSNAGQQTSAGGSTTPQNANDVMGTLEKYKNDCKPAVVADSLFTPPADVQFQDFSKLMAPSGAVPTGASQQDVQKMMQQYQQQAPQGNSGY